MPYPFPFPTMAKRKPELPWSALERELETVQTQIARLEREVARAAKPKPLRRPAATPAPTARSQAQHPRSSVDSSASSAAAGPAPATVVGRPPVVITPTPSQETWPSGADLAEPKSFGVKPPYADLVQGLSSPEEYRRRLAQHLAFANQVLHTSGVVAVVWREWRAFARAVEEKLRATNAAPNVAPV